MWEQLQSAIPPYMRVANFFTSNPMVRREMRLKEAKTNAERCNRDLNRDRLDLERKEKKLMSMVKSFAEKGDIPKAKIVARQIAHLRSCADRNFESSTMISTRAQLMASNHKINRAEIEAIKGARYANLEDSVQSMAQRERKYAKRMGEFEEMERIMNEGMDEVYESAEEDRKKRDYFELEADAVLKQALDPQKWKGRPYVETSSSLSSLSTRSRVALNLHVYDPSQFTKRLFPQQDSEGSSFSLSPLPSQFSESVEDSNETLHQNKRTPTNHAKKNMGVSLYIETLDLSVDMLKRIISRDAYVISQLHLGTNPKGKAAYDAVLGTTKPFRIGFIDQMPNGSVSFVPFEFFESLKKCG